MFLIFFVVLLTPFASFQSVEDIFNGKDEAKLSMKLNDIFSSSGRYSENIKADDSIIASLIQDDMLFYREKRQLTKKSSRIVKNNNKKRKPVRKITRKPLQTTRCITRNRLRRTRTTTKKPLRKTKRTTTKKLPTTEQPVIQTTKSKVVDVFAEYKANLIKEMNKLRKKHHVAPLQLNTTIAEEAQDFVEDIFAKNFNVWKYSGPLGEIYYSGLKDNRINPLELWFENADSYDFNRNYMKIYNGYPRDAMFTQIVWKNSKQIDCGVTEEKEKFFVICRFYPKGNIDREFIENISRPN